MEQQVLLISVGIFIIVAFLVLVIVMQQSKLKRLEQPKYGFLGKPLAGILTTVVLGAGLIGGVYLVNQDQTTFETSANLKIRLSYTKELISDNGNTATYLFKATPIIEGDTNPTLTKEFNVFWNLVGPQKLSRSEVRVSAANPSEEQMTLRKGTYDLVILVVYNDPQTGNSYSQTLKETIII